MGLKKSILFFTLIIIPSYMLSAQDKPVISVLNFKTSGISKSEVQIFIDYLSSLLFETGKFHVIERKERDKILMEQEFSLSDFTDESSQIEIGRLLSSDLIVTGSIGLFQNNYLLSIKLIDVETSEILEIASDKFLSVDELLNGTKYLAYKIAGDRDKYIQKKKEEEKKRELEEKDRRREDIKNKRRSAWENFLSNFAYKKMTFVFDLAFGAGTTTYDYKYEKYSYPSTYELEYKTDYSIFILVNIGFGLKIFNILVTEAILGIGYEEYTLNIVSSNDVSLATPEKNIITHPVFMIGGRLYIGNKSNSISFLLDLGYLDTDLTFKGLYYSFGICFKNWFLSLSPVASGLYVNLGYSFDL